MTGRREAEAALFDRPVGMSTNVNKPTRRRLDATICPICQGWVEVHLNPVRLHCTGCGVEARL